MLRGGCGAALKIDTADCSYCFAENNAKPSFCFDSGWGVQSWELMDASIGHRLVPPGVL